MPDQPIVLEPKDAPKPPPGVGDQPSAPPKVSPEMEAFVNEGVDGKPPVPGSDISFEVPESLKDKFTDDVKKAYIDRAKDIARQEGLKPSQAQAFLQGLAELQGDLTASVDSASQAEEQQQAEELVLAWKREVATDPQLGGSRYTSTMVLAEDGARRLGGHVAAVAFLRHLRGEEVMPGPMLVRMFHLAAATMKEDRINGLVMRKGPETRTLSDALYGKTMKPNPKG